MKYFDAVKFRLLEQLNRRGVVVIRNRSAVRIEYDAGKVLHLRGSDVLEFEQSAGELEMSFIAESAADCALIAAAEYLEPREREAAKPDETKQGRLF